VYGSSGLLAKKGTAALKSMNLALEADDPSILAVVGESGSGKSTLASLILGFISATEGEVLYNGKDVKRLSNAERQVYRREVQAIFQDPFAVYNPFYRVDHVLNVPLSKFKLARTKAEAQRMMEEALSAVGLRPEETLGRYPHQLSGGQRQRIVVARALMLKPKLIIADEPVSMVDASLRATILESLRTLNKDLRIPVVYITHDLATAYHVSDQIVVLFRGEVVESGETETVIKNPQHSYTKLLIDSIPWPDPERRWGQTKEEFEQELHSVARQATASGSRWMPE
jgi:peptide/nickel transport system ATP-binding protein